MDDIKKSERNFIILIIILIPLYILISKYILELYKPIDSAYKFTELDKDVFEMLKVVENETKFITLSNTRTRKLSNIYSTWGAVKLDKYSFGGDHSPWLALNQSVPDDLDSMYNAFDNYDCKKINDLAVGIEIEQIISYNMGCYFLRMCNLTLQAENERACLFNTALKNEN